MFVPLTISDFLRRAEQVYGARVGVIDEHLQPAPSLGELTYARVAALARAQAAGLDELGVGFGERVAIVSHNAARLMAAFFGVAGHGRVLVPVNFRLSAMEIAYIVEHSGATLLLVDPELDEPLRAVKCARRVVLGPDSDALLRFDRTPVSWAADEGATATINYTSGTTARPKGVMLTHRNVYINAYNFIAHLRIRHEDREMWTLPMFHANGWGGPFAITAMGATHVVLRAVVGADIYQMIQDEQITFACMAPAVLSTVLNFPDKTSYRATTRPRFVVAGAPPPAAFIERLEKELGWEFIQIYGLTETAPILTVSGPDHQNPEGQDYQRRSRAGVEAIGVDIQVLDDEGNPVPMDNETVGEVCARSNVVLKGYWEQPEETARAIYGGFFHSGDLGVWDEFGNVNIVDRKKDVIISGGENISSPEVEAALYKHPAVLECAVIGVPSEKWGETPKALVVLRDGMTATEEEVIAFSREHLAHFRCPTSVDFVESLPRTVTGKLQKFIIRKQYWKGVERRVN